MFSIDFRWNVYKVCSSDPDNPWIQWPCYTADRLLIDVTLFTNLSVLPATYVCN